MFLILLPAPSLSSLVLGYRFVQDLAGSYEGKPIRTSPHPFAVLTIHLGRPNTDSSGRAVPLTCLLGLQSHARDWISGPDTYFVMVLLSVGGLLRLFPETGADTVNHLLDLGSLVGDRQAHGVTADVTAAWEPQLIASQLDRWLLRRLQTIRCPKEAVQFTTSCEVLRREGRVDTAAEEVGISRRQLHRWSRMHLGLGPKEWVDLQRLQASVHSVQTGHGDPTTGFSDQAHQIRTWRRRLDVTPGTYRQTLLSVLACQTDVALSQETVVHYL